MEQVEIFTGKIFETKELSKEVNDWLGSFEDGITITQRLQNTTATDNGPYATITIFYTENPAPN